MTVKERLLALRLLEKQRNNPELTKQLGITVKIVSKTVMRKQSVLIVGSKGVVNNQ